MTPFDEARALVAAHAWRLSPEHTTINEALGRVLAEPVKSDMDMPPFNKAMVDGFACRRGDLPGVLNVVEEIPAGVFPTVTIQRGQCARIMTGAPVPQGADCVVMIEHTAQPAPNRVQIATAADSDNIAPRGEDLRTGDVVLRAGHRIRPQDCAVLAAVGATNPLVARRPRVGVIATGSELVTPDNTPGPGQIRNSNAAQMIAISTACGAIVRDYGIAEDTAIAQADALARALDENDVVLTTGGVSVGDFDLMPDLIAKSGLEIRLRKIAMQPGKPMIFATRDDNACFGLSGNPVSSFVQFVLFARPFLLQLQGAQTTQHELTLPLGEDFKRKPGDRILWRPAAISPEGTYVGTPYHGSGHVNALSTADALVPLPADSPGLIAGTQVRGVVL